MGSLIICGHDETHKSMYMHIEAVKVGAKVASIACVASAIPIVSVLLMQHQFNSMILLVFINLK